MEPETTTVLEYDKKCGVFGQTLEFLILHKKFSQNESLASNFSYLRILD